MGLSNKRISPQRHIGKKESTAIEGRWKKRINEEKKRESRFSGKYL
jgi:hypothetical protein